MLKTIILLTGNIQQQRALCALLKEHNPALSFRRALTLDELTGLEPEVLRDSRLIAFTSDVIVPAATLGRLGHGAYHFHSDPPDYPATAHFALTDDDQGWDATAHTMVERVDRGPIVGIEPFPMHDKIAARKLEQIAFERLAHLFWRMSRRIACEPGPPQRYQSPGAPPRARRSRTANSCEILPTSTQRN